jgi:CHASE3 domain sensor protein
MLVTHTHVALEALDDLRAAGTDVETKQPGYVITSDETYREPYLTAMEMACDAGKSCWPR